jgi:hypothetical protein
MTSKLFSVLYSLCPCVLETIILNHALYLLKDI